MQRHEALTQQVCVIAEYYHVLDALSVMFTPVQCGAYPCLLTLSSGYDTRVLYLDGKATSAATQLTMELSVPARQTLIQEIPFSNPSKEDWTVNIDVKGVDFQAPRSVLVPAGQTKTFPVTFRPVKEGRYTGELVLLAGDERANIKLIGVSEEPLAEDRISIKCPARKEMIQVCVYLLH